jgi:ATP-dependent DNA helicase RecG
MTSTVDHLATLAPADVGRAVRELVEDQWFDRKSIRIDAAKLAKTLVALANAEGGVVIVGVHGRAIEGTDAHAIHRNSLMQASFDHTEPPVRVHHELVACIDEHGEADHLLVITVDSSDVVHTTKADECYLRVGDEDRRLRFEQRQELVFDKGQSHFDGIALVDTTLDDLDASALDAYAAEVGSTDPVRTLHARGLTTRSGAVTTAALLLFGTAPQQRFPQAYVRVLRYAGVDRGTGSRLNVREDVRCEGNIPAMIDAAVAQVERLQPTRTALGKRGRFERIAVIPHDAWLEAIVNAVVHRSYSIGGDHIRVEIFDDRIEVTSPGRFPGVTRVDDMRAAPRFAHNPRIARVCADLRFGRELGEGIKRMYDEMRSAGLVDPAYRQTPASVSLILTSSALDASTAEHLPPGSIDVLNRIRAEGGISTGDLAAALELSKPAILVRLRALQDAGLIDWVGTSKKDPRAYWKLHEG